MLRCDVKIFSPRCEEYRIDDGHAIFACGGTSIIVYRFQKISIALPRGVVAIKVVPFKFLLFANQEIENALCFQADPSRKGICTVLLKSYRLLNNSSALVFSAYEPVRTPTFPLVRLAAQCIGRLHATGYAHGDYRWPNFVIDNDRMLLADQALLQPAASVTVSASLISLDLSRHWQRWGGAQDMNQPSDSVLQKVWSEATTVYDQYVDIHAEAPSEKAALIFINYFGKVFVNGHSVLYHLDSV